MLIAFKIYDLINFFMIKEEIKSPETRTHNENLDPTLMKCYVFKFLLDFYISLKEFQVEDIISTVRHIR